MLSIWPKDEKLKQFLNRLLRKIRRLKLDSSLADVDAAGIVKLLKFGKQKQKFTYLMKIQD